MAQQPYFALDQDEFHQMMSNDAETYERIVELEAEADHLRAERDALRALLQEWRATPFFDTFPEWEQWVSDFGERVDAALADATAGALADRQQVRMERCSLCTVDYPYPVGLHHTEEECYLNRQELGNNS